MESKPWYLSKGIIFALATVLVFGGNWLAGWLSPNVTADQMEALRSAEPQVQEVVEKLKNGESILNLLGTIAGIAFGIIRAWFIKTPSLTILGATTNKGAKRAA